MLPLTHPSSAPRRVLIIKPSAIGDVVHALPVLNLMRKQWPEAHVAWLVTPPCAGLLQGHPQLNETIVFERRKYGQSWRSPAALRELLRFTVALRRKEFDLVVDLQGLLRSGWLGWTTGARRRVGMGYAREGAPFFYTHRVPQKDPNRHAIERYLDVAESLGLPRGPVEFVFNLTEGDRSVVAELLAPLGGGRPFAVLLPGTNWETKKWPVERYARLAGLLRERMGLSIVVAGGKDDQRLADVIAPELSLCGRTTLAQTTALLERAALVVANDTGPMHIASALGRPLVTLYGPTSAVRTGPYDRPKTVTTLNLPCSPCLSRHCSHRSCMNWMGEEAVLADAQEAVRRSGLVGV